MTPTLVEERAEWAAWLRDSEVAGRFLTGISNAVGPAQADPLSDIAAAGMIEALRRSSQNSLDHLIDALDLVCGDHLEFITREIVPALRVLRPEWSRTPRITSALGSGVVRWPDTVVGRASRRIRQHDFVVVQRRRDADSAELRAIGAYLADLVRCGELLVAIVGAKRAHVRLQQLTRAASDLLRAEPFGTRPPTLRPGDSDILKGSRHPAARRAAQRLRTRGQMKSAGRRGLLSAAFMALSANWLEPVVDDALFELLVLARVLQIIERRLGFGPPVVMGLLFEGNGRIAHFQKDGWSFDVHFDRAPAPLFGGKSRYAAIRESYSGLVLNDRRPDLTLSWSNGETRHALLIEMKCSTDSAYIRQSIYKAFGYAWDLADAVPFRSPENGIAIVFPAASEIRGIAPHPDRVTLGNETEDSLEEILLAAGAPLLKG